MKESVQIGKGLQLTVQWYDHVSEQKRGQTYEGEVVGWKASQVIVRVKDYGVLRFWKKSGVEVGNKDHERRGFRLDLPDLAPSADGAKPVGIPVNLEIPES